MFPFFFNRIHLKTYSSDHILKIVEEKITIFYMKYLSMYRYDLVILFFYRFLSFVFTTSCRTPAACSGPPKSSVFREREVQGSSSPHIIL